MAARRRIRTLMHTLRWGLLIIPLAVGLMLVAQTPADAAALKLISGVTTIVCDEDLFVNPAGCSFPSAGLVAFVGSVGGFLTIDATASFPALGSAGAAELDVVSLVLGTASGTISIQGTQYGFSGSGTGEFDFTVGGTNTAATGSTATFNAYSDLANAKFGTTNLLGTLGPFGPGAFSASSVVSGAVDAAYSLTLESILVFTSTGGSISFDENLRQRVPEAASGALLGLGLMSLVMARRRKSWSPA